MLNNYPNAQHAKKLQPQLYLSLGNHTHSLFTHYFSESMFVRFQPFDAEGTWKGKQLD